MSPKYELRLVGEDEGIRGAKRIVFFLKYIKLNAISNLSHMISYVNIYVLCRS